MYRVDSANSAMDIFKFPLLLFTWNTPHLSRKMSDNPHLAQSLRSKNHLKILHFFLLSFLWCLAKGELPVYSTIKLPLCCTVAVVPELEQC